MKLKRDNSNSVSIDICYEDMLNLTSLFDYLLSDAKLSEKLEIELYTLSSVIKSIRRK